MCILYLKNKMTVFLLSYLIIFLTVLITCINSLPSSYVRISVPSRASCLQMKMNTLFDSWKKIKLSTAQVTSQLLRNPIARIVSNTYEFFYWYPRKNLPYDSPWMLFRSGEPISIIFFFSFLVPLFSFR